MLAQSIVGAFESLTCAENFSGFPLRCPRLPPLHFSRCHAVSHSSSLCKILLSLQSCGWYPRHSWKPLGPAMFQLQAAFHRAFNHNEHARQTMACTMQVYLRAQQRVCASPRNRRLRACCRFLLSACGLACGIWWHDGQGR